MDQNLVGSRGGSINFSNAALAQASMAGAYNTFNVANKVSYVIDGKFYAAAISTNQVMSAGHTAIANNQAVVFGVWANNTGVFSTTQGDIVDSKEVEDGKRSLSLPDLVSNKALIGLIKVKAGVLATFTPGTTNFNATNINTTFVNVGTSPVTPFTTTVTAA
jgi:hypothetical protein